MKKLLLATAIASSFNATAQIHTDPTDGVAPLPENIQACIDDMKDGGGVSCDFKNLPLKTITDLELEARKSENGNGVIHIKTGNKSRVAPDFSQDPDYTNVTIAKKDDYNIMYVNQDWVTNGDDQNVVNGDMLVIGDGENQVKITRNTVDGNGEVKVTHKDGTEVVYQVQDGEILDEVIVAPIEEGHEYDLVVKQFNEAIAKVGGEAVIMRDPMTDNWTLYAPGKTPVDLSEMEVDEGRYFLLQQAADGLRNESGKEQAIAFNKLAKYYGYDAQVSEHGILSFTSPMSGETRTIDLRNEESLEIAKEMARDYLSKGVEPVVPIEDEMPIYDGHEAAIKHFNAAIEGLGGDAMIMKDPMTGDWTLYAPGKTPVNMAEMSVDEARYFLMEEAANELRERTGKEQASAFNQLAEKFGHDVRVTEHGLLTFTSPMSGESRTIDLRNDENLDLAKELAKEHLKRGVEPVVPIEGEMPIYGTPEEVAKAQIKLVNTLTEKVNSAKETLTDTQKFNLLANEAGKSGYEVTSNEGMLTFTKVTEAGTTESIEVSHEAFQLAMAEKGAEMAQERDQKQAERELVASPIEKMPIIGLPIEESPQPKLPGEKLSKLRDWAEEHRERDFIDPIDVGQPVDGEAPIEKPMPIVGNPDNQEKRQERRELRKVERSERKEERLVQREERQAERTAKREERKAQREDNGVIIVDPIEQAPATSKSVAAVAAASVVDSRAQDAAIEEIYSLTSENANDIKTLFNEVERLDDKMDSVMASTHAINNARPFLRAKGQTAIGVGTGFAGSEAAVAIGAAHAFTDNWSASATFNVTTGSHSEVSGGAGVQYVW